MRILVLVSLLQHRVLKGVTFAQRPITMIVIVHPLVDGRGLLTDGLDGGMGMQKGEPSGESVVGNSVDAHLAIVVRHMLQQELDRVVGIR